MVCRMWHFRGSYVAFVWLRGGNRFGTLKEEAQESMRYGMTISESDWPRIIPHCNPLRAAVRFADKSGPRFLSEA